MLPTHMQPQPQGDSSSSNSSSSSSRSSREAQPVQQQGGLRAPACLPACLPADSPQLYCTRLQARWILCHCQL